MVETIALNLSKMFEIEVLPHTPIISCLNDVCKLGLTLTVSGADTC